MHYPNSIVPASFSSFDEALLAAQARVPGAAEAFIAAHDDWIVRTTRALCRKLGVAPQEHQDAVQETYRRLLDPCLKRFAPNLGGGKGYVRGVILNSIDFAGRRRRRAREVSAAMQVDDSSELVDHRWQRSFDQAEKLADLPKLLTPSGPLFSNAFMLVCRDGLSQREAAKVIGVSESKLSRVLAKFPARSNVVGA